MMRLSEAVSVNRRFSRSMNVERDHGAEAIAGYLPTGRAIDVVSRVCSGFQDSSAGRAFSITGPHGGGKSSLAVFLDALLAPRVSIEHQAAVNLVAAIDNATSRVVLAGLNNIDPAGGGFVRAFATAEREPVTRTVARALWAAAQRDLGPGQQVVPQHMSDVTRMVSAREILAAVREISELKPVVLVVDEFGKNLESYMDSGSDGDLYLLQQLAELGQGAQAPPFTILTLQHLSFDEYVQDASVQRRREWSKVQGRFQDIPYVETFAQSLHLISAALEVESAALRRKLAAWYRREEVSLIDLGLREVASAAVGSYPLHPTVLSVLPHLCSRYGQNERTLFSFLGGSEPKAVPKFLEEATWDGKAPPPFVGLDRVYDYFVESSGTTLGASSGASRWLEIESRIRDAFGVTPEERTVLKTIGVLNLVSTSGHTRASEALVLAALSAPLPNLSSTQARLLIESLQQKGFINYREYSDEFRIWQGTDYDLKSTVEAAKASIVNSSLDILLSQAAPLDPAVAGRSSQERGILRLFERSFADFSGPLEPSAGEDDWDGRLILSTALEVSEATTLPKGSRPVVVAVPLSIDGLREAAIETHSLSVALREAELVGADWVARREIAERLAVAGQGLSDLIVYSWGPGNVRWKCLNGNVELSTDLTTSGALSVASDIVYDRAPVVANEMLAKRELSSQGSKARRLLIEAMLRSPNLEAFGLEGYGPERAMYEALFRSTGLHRQIGECWSISEPGDERWKEVWLRLNNEIDATTDGRRNLVEIGSVLKQPPYGLKDGILPVLLLSALSNRESDVALYEHGTLVMHLDDAVAERLARNPVHFTVKNLATGVGVRRDAMASISRALIISEGDTERTFLQVARAIYRELRSLPPYTHNSKRGLSPVAQKVRDLFRTSTEPDVLFFNQLPRALGLDEFKPNARSNKARGEEFAARLTDVLLELKAHYPNLIVGLTHRLAEATGATTRELAELQRRLVGQAVNLVDHVLDPRLRAFLGALSRDQLEPEAWLLNACMVVVDGHSPRTWTDELEDRFAMQVVELGGALRRTQALLYERVASGGESVEMRRVTVTHPDGSEEAEILAITEMERDLIEGALADGLVTLDQAFGSKTAARRSLLAWLVLGRDQSHSAEVQSTTPNRGESA